MSGPVNVFTDDDQVDAEFEAFRHFEQEVENELPDLPITLVHGEKPYSLTSHPLSGHVGRNARLWRDRQ